MLHHGLVGSQRSQSYCLKVHFQESSGLVGLSSRVDAKGYGPKIKFWNGWYAGLPKIPSLAHFWCQNSIYSRVNPESLYFSRVKWVSGAV